MAGPCYASSASIPWVRFHWVGFTSAGKHFAKAVLLVPVRIRSDPKIYYMQLDTGSAATVFYKAPYRGKSDPISGRNSGKPFNLHLRVGETQLDLSGLRIDGGLSADMKGPYPVIGTLGQSSFMKDVLFIDFVHQRIAWMSPSKVRAADLAGVSFVHMTARNGLLFIPIRLDHVVYPDGFLYDSGSSLFQLITVPGLWSHLTGKSMTEKGLPKIRIYQWGKAATMVGAKVEGPLSIGPVRLKNPMAWVQASGGAKRSNIAYAKFRLKGIVGNAPFDHCCMIVIDGPLHRFGIKKFHKPI